MFTEETLYEVFGPNGEILQLVFGLLFAGLAMKLYRRLKGER